MKNDEMSLGPEDDFSRPSLSEKTRWMAAILLPLGVAAIAAATGFAPVAAGERGASSVLFAPIFASLVLAAAVWPLKQGQWLPSPEHPDRLLPAVAVTSIPLLSFAYFLGNFRDAYQAWDAFVAVVPPVAVGWVAFRRTQQESWFALLAGLGTFIPLFLFNDALGPFRTVVACAPGGSIFHTLRTVAAFGGIALAAHSLEVERAPLRRCLAALAIASVAVDIVLPRLLEVIGTVETTSPTYSWFALVPALYFLFRRTEFSRKAFLAIALLELFAIPVRLIALATASENSLVAQAQIALETLTLGYFVSVLIRASREMQVEVTAPAGA